MWSSCRNWRSVCGLAMKMYPLYHRHPVTPLNLPPAKQKSAIIFMLIIAKCLAKIYSNIIPQTSTKQSGVPGQHCEFSNWAINWMFQGWIPSRDKRFSSSQKMSKSSLGPTESPIQLVVAILSWALKSHGWQNDHSPPSIDKIRTEHSYT